MTQIFTGVGLGSRGSSLGQLGSYGPKGNAGLGQGGASVSVNAANGNVVLKQADGFLADFGTGLDLFQSYNSRDSGAWRFNTDSRLSFEGQPHAKGAIVNRTDEDGHISRFVYDAGLHAYLAEDGSTARLTFDGTCWNYREGTGQTTCHYNTEGQLIRLSDRDGHVLQFGYQNGLLTTVTDKGEKQSITWSFQDGLLRDVIFQSDGQTVHHLHYGYDAARRLNRVARDLDEGKTYWIAYDYEGDSNLISGIRQSDGTSLHLDYDAEGRIKRLVDGEGRITTYDYFVGKTVVTNGLGESWAYYYDADARLTGIDGPEQYHVRYHYQGRHLDSITEGHQQWQFAYNDQGDCVRIESPTGDITQRTYDSEHRLLSETRYQAFDGNHQPIKPQTTRFLYDDNGHLRYEITPDGTVTEHRYDTNGSRINSRCYRLSRWQAPTSSLDELMQWSALQSQQDVHLIDYHYDWRGCLSEEIHYTQVDASGEGISTVDAIRTYSRFDAAGRLLEQSSLTPTGLSTTHYLYDDLGRLIQTMDNQHHTQAIEYDDAHQRVVKTDANGLQTISIYDKSGLLLSTQRLDLTHDYGTATYRYDDAGRLISETDVTGKTRYLFYDARARLEATVSSSGQVTEYRYDDEGHCIQTRQYQQTISTKNLQIETAFAAIKPLATALDRVNQVVYNANHQIGWQIDADGAVIAFQYDAAGRVTSKTAYANRLNAPRDVQLTPAFMRLTPTADDRTMSYYYDVNGRLKAEVNGEGYATAYRYDAQGHVVEQIRYKNKIITERTGDWATDAPLPANARDIHTYSLYNAAGLKEADIDAEGYVTAYTYDARGLLVDTVAYYTRLPYPVTIHERTTLDAIRPDAHINDHHTTYRYNDLNQLTEEQTQAGLVITYAYDTEGHVTQKTRTDCKTHEARGQCYRYDTLGRLTQSLDALGAALLAEDGTLSLDEIETIWQQHSVRYAYDISGHMVSQTNALNETSRFIYNEAGLLVYSVSATGAVTETRYNGFQQVETSIRYSAYYPTDAKAGLQNIQQYMEEHADAKRDEVTHYEYNTLGFLLSKRTGSHAEQVTTYNAFGERLQTAQLGTLTDYQYDRRGLLRYRTEDVGGINKTLEVQYDAFGRVEKEWDGRRGVILYELNKRGEQVFIENQGHGETFKMYDAFGRITFAQDTSTLGYTYDDLNNTLTLAREGIPSTIVTQFNAFGDKLSITDGNHHTTTYQYDTRGLLTHIDAPEHATTDYTYDAAGRLTFQEDAGGHVCRYTYDAEGHVLTKTIDPDGLNITTIYSYDAIGRQLQIIDAGRCTQFTYDNQGYLIEKRQDPNGLNILTTFNYNENGQLMRETRMNAEGANWVTAYTRDALGRCLTRTIDPDGLQLTTRFTYDNNNNVISQTDANHHITHFIYDPNNRIRYQLDARGVVTEHRYDRNGNEIQTTTYANRIPSVDFYDEAHLASMIQPDSLRDHYQFFAFDTQSRLMKSYDGLGYETEYTYDANDNVVTKIEYAIPCSLNALKAGRRPLSDGHGQTRITRFAYDGLNHERFRIDTNGRLTESRYDALGQLIQQTRFLNPLGLGEQGQTYCVATIQARIKEDPLHDESTLYAYDAAGRLSLKSSAAGCVTAYGFDDAGNQISSRQYATRLTEDQQRDSNWARWIQSSPDDRLNRAVYDAAGRLRYRISSTGHVVERRYDAVGNVVAEIAHAERWPLNTTIPLTEDNAHLTTFEYDAAGRLLTQTDAAYQTTRYTYDKNNNVASKTDANQAVWTYEYNASNQLTETHAPIVPVSTYVNGVWREEPRSIITKNEYDSFGNVATVIRDAGGLNQTVRYVYDANNRAIQTIYPDVPVNHADTKASPNRSENLQTLTESSTYNAFGEMIEHCDRAGFSHYFAYDDLGQQTYAVNAEGYVTKYQYDAFGNVTTKTAYATRLDKKPIQDYSLKGIAAATIANPQYDRHEYSFYDKDHHLTESRLDAIRMYNSRTRQYAVLSPTTRMGYNALGDVETHAVQLTDTDWATTTYRYDSDGLKTAMLDAEHYLTTYTYNTYGLLEGETQYASRTSDVSTPPASTPKDRHVSFLYDAKGQLTEKTLKHVTVMRLTGNGSKYETVTQDLTSRYGYDAMGHLVSTTDANGFTAFSYYNAAGQLTALVGAETDAGRKATTYRYDALGLLIESHQWAAGTESATETQFTLNQASIADKITHDLYNTSGQLIQKTDGIGHVTQYSYDANGNMARSWQVFTQADGTTLLQDKRYAYDHENHLTQTTTLKASGGASTDDAEYNAFGDVIKKGFDGQMATQVDYDQAGRVWRSNTQGYFQIYVYDLEQHVTQVVTSTNGFGRESVDLSESSYEACISYDRDISRRFDLQRHDNTYDALGRLVGQSQESHMNHADKDDPIERPKVTQTQTVDRWGNILLHTNASGYTTRYEYNALNALTEQVLPEVRAVDEHGIAHTLAPVIRYAVDALGQTIAMTDANGHTIAHVFDAEGRITQDIDALGYHRDKAYNLLGQMAQQTDERGCITTYHYDAENRLLSVTTPNTTQRYVYNEAGLVTRQTDAAGDVQTLLYDELDHVIQTTGIHGTTTFEYDTAGHKTAEHDANGKSRTWGYDEHGRLKEHTDLGGHRTDYTYNTNGLLLNETSTSGKEVNYFYYSDGQVLSYEDKAHLENIKYTYDEEGRVASKLTGRPEGWTPETDYYQYDALGRLSHVTRRAQASTNPGIPTPDFTLLSVDYEYDAVGNIRDTQVTANYTGYHATSHIDYFRYDKNNRMILNKGQLINGDITISAAQGTVLGYDAAGNIHDAELYEGSTPQRYRYDYNAENQLERTHKNDLDLQSKRYVNGQLIEETAYNPRGRTAQHTLYRYERGQLVEQKMTDWGYQVLNDTRYHYDNTVGNLLQTVTVAPGDVNPNGYTQIHDYGYAFWDSYLQTTDQMTLNMSGFATRTATSTRRYDMNGLLENVTDTPEQANTTDYFASNIDGIRARKDGKGQTNYLTVAGKTIGDLRLDHDKTQHLNVYGGTLPDTQKDNLGTYTLNAGDTLESIAFQIYGDSSLWYLIADANGITDRTAHAGEKGSQLQTGCRLTLPQITKGQHNTNQTHTVLSSSDWTGETGPSISSLTALPPAPPPQTSHHNSLLKTIAKITVVVTGAVAMVLSAGALAVLATGVSVSGLGVSALITAGLNALGGSAVGGVALGLPTTLAIGFAAGFTSSIVGQTAAVAFNLQHGIDFNGALMSGLGTAATAGVSHILQTSTAYQDIRGVLDKASTGAFNVVNAAEMMERDAVTQSLNLALSHHQHFDWLELGVSAATAGVMGSDLAQSATQALQDKLHSATAFVTSEVQALATGAATGHFDAAQILQDNLGNAVSASLFQAETTPAEAEYSAIPDGNDEIEEGGYCPIPVPEEEENFSPIPEGSWAIFQRERAMHQRLQAAAGRAKLEVGGLTDVGSSLGVIGEAAYGPASLLPVGQGALAADNKNTKSSNFDLLQERIFVHEGQFSNDPNDRGGNTNKGITLSTFEQYAKKDLGINPTLHNLKQLTNEQASIIYKKHFWDPIKVDEIHSVSIAYALYDFHVNAPGQAVQLMQKSVNALGGNLVVDNKVGPKTIKAINELDSRKLFDVYQKSKIDYYTNRVNVMPSQKKYLNGWLNRVRSIQFGEEK